MKNWTIAPEKKATPIERRIPKTMVKAFAVLIYSHRFSESSEYIILIAEIATAAPRSSNTMDTVVDVGSP